MTILSDYDLKKMYCDFLDEIYPECKIAGYEYSTSRALAEIDPTAFRCGFADWLDSMSGESLWELPDGTWTDEDPEESEG